MAIFRKLHTAFWQDAKVIEELTPEDKFFFIYLLTNPATTQIGIYQITKKQMSFELGYSIESINSLMDRFENHHKLIKYNPYTREIALKNWGKYNLDRSGKPMLDCVKKELEEVSDISLIEYVSKGIKKEDIKDEKTNRAANGGNGKPPYYEIKVKTKKNNKFGKAIAICLVCSLGIGTGIGAGYGFSRAVSGNKGNTYDGVLTTTAAAVSSIKSSSASDAIASVYSAVVSITTESEGMANYGFYTVPYKAQGAGSGVIFSEDSSLVYVATNEHVIDGAQNIAIAFDDADEIIPATVVGYDETTDLAVLSVEKADLEAQGIENVTIATFDTSEEVNLGESVIAIGNSLGEGKTTTGGMISAENKTVNVEGKELEVIQTDAAINPGNSGGALVDYSGAVIGINTAKTFTTTDGSSAEGVGYAIPSSIAVPILQEIRETGSVEKPYLGITGQDITTQLSELYRLPVGVLVTSVISGGCAEQAGIEEGDVIVSYNDTNVMDMDTLVALVGESNVGDEVKIGIIRNGDTAVDVTAVLGNINDPGTAKE